MKFFVINILRTLSSKYLLMLLVLAMIGSTTPVMATSTIKTDPIIISFSVSDGLFGNILKVHKNLAYAFNTSIEFPGGSPFNSDIYFGILPPGRDKVLTWIKNSEENNLQGNLLPIVKGIKLEEKFTFNLASVLNRTIEYTFTGTEPSGMYLIFTLVVISGENPSEPNNWIAVNMRPLFFNQ